MSAFTDRLKFFRELGHQVHIGRCTKWPYGDCPRHEDLEYFTPKDNDIASAIMRWLERDKGITPWK